MGSVNLRDGLVGEWHFKGNATDSVGSNDGTVSGATLTTDKDGRLNSAYAFGGVSDEDYITLSTSPDLLTDCLAVSLRFKTSKTGLYQCLIGQGDEASTGFNCIQINNSNIIRYTSTGGADPVGSTTVTDGEWHHIVAIKQVTTGYFLLYLDGVIEIDSTDVIWFGADASVDNCVVGATHRSTIVSKFEGDINDIKIWNRALSVEEVKQLYGEIKPHYQPIFEDCLVYYDFKGDEKDISGNGNNATTASNTTPTTGRIGNDNRANSYNGSNSYIAMPSGVEPAAYPFTFNAWAMIDSGGRLICLSYSGSYNAILEIGIYSNYARIYTKNSPSSDLATGTTLLNDNEWHMITGVFETSLISIYVDGALENSATNTEAIPSSLNYWSIGRLVYEGTDSYYSGDIGECAIFDSGFSVGKVKELYDLTKNKYITPFSQGGKD